VKTITYSGRQSVSMFIITSAQGLGSLIRIDRRFDSERYLEILDNTVFALY
jgi:hypothetical protein